MNFIGDEEIDNILTQFEKQLPGSLDRDVPSIMESFDNTMQQVVSQLSADVSSSGQIKRSFKFD